MDSRTTLPWRLLGATAPGWDRGGAAGKFAEEPPDATPGRRGGCGGGGLVAEDARRVVTDPFPQRGGACEASVGSTNSSEIFRDFTQIGHTSSSPPLSGNSDGPCGSN